MKLISLLVAAAPALASAFVAPSSRAALRAPATRARSQGALGMVVIDDLKFDKALATMEAEKAGVSAPFGFFDPIGFYKGKTIRQKKKLRESELKHGRIAMLAILGIFVQEHWAPLLPGDAVTAVEQFNQLEDTQGDLWLILLFVASLAESKSIAKGWDPIEDTFKQPKIAGLRDDFVTGDLEFDPLGLCPDDEDSFVTMRTKELNNGRLAMLGLLGVIAQELVTGQPLFA